MEREASVKLTLDSGQYLVELRKLGDASEQVGKRAAKGTTAWNSALTGVKSQFGALGSQVKSLISTAATLGGAFTLGSAIKGAVDLQSRLSDLAFRVQIATKRTTDWRDLQRQLEPVAMRTSRSTTELAEAFDQVFTETGNADLAMASMEAIGTAATATGKSVQQMGSLAGALGDKFGVTAQEMPQALASLTELAERGGLGFDDMQRAVHLLGASARAAGMSGTEGLSRMIALANIGGDALGTTKKGLMAITTIVDQMADPAVAKEFKSAWGVAITDAKGEARDLTAVLEDVMRKTGGKREALGKVFSGEQLKALVELGSKFQAGFEKTEGTLKEKQEAGVQSFREALQEAGKSSLTFADLQKQAEKRAQDPQRKLAVAMEKMSQEFTKREFLDSINKLSGSLPKLADAIAKVVNFVGAHPLAAGAALVGGRVGLGIAEAQGAALGRKAAQEVGAKIAATTIGQSIAKAATSSGGWGAVAGKAVGVAAAAAIAFAIGQHLIDKTFEGKAADQRSHAIATAKSGGGLKSKEEAAAMLRAQIERESKEGPGFVENITHGLAGVGHKLGLNEDPGMQPEIKAQNQLADKREQLRKLESEIARLKQNQIQEVTVTGGAPAAAPKPVAPGQLRAKIEDQGSFANVIARSLAGQTLKVEVINPTASGSRGPLDPGAPKPGHQPR